MRKFLALVCCVLMLSGVLSCAAATPPPKNPVSWAVKLIEMRDLPGLRDHLYKHPEITVYSKSVSLGLTLLEIAWGKKNNALEFDFQDSVKAQAVLDYLVELMYRTDEKLALNPNGVEIWFYNKYEPFYVFTNFWRPLNKATFGEWHILYDGKEWATSEHAFQAAKFKKTNNTVYKKILESSDPMGALKIAQNNTATVDPAWHEPDSSDPTIFTKQRIMEEVVEAKFRQHDELRTILLATGNKRLVENAPKDYDWGIGNGTGKNWLGKILMKVRAKLRAEKEAAGTVAPPPLNPKMAQSLHDLQQQLLLLGVQPH